MCALLDSSLCNQSIWTLYTDQMLHLQPWWQWRQGLTEFKTLNVAKVSNVATSTITNTPLFSTVLLIALHLHAKPCRRVLARRVSWECRGRRQGILGMRDASTVSLRHWTIQAWLMFPVSFESNAQMKLYIWNVLLKCRVRFLILLAINTFMQCLDIYVRKLENSVKQHVKTSDL